MARDFLKRMNAERVEVAEVRQIIVDIMKEEGLRDLDFFNELLRERIDETRFKHLSDMKYSQSIRARSLMKPVGQQEMSPPALSLSSPAAPL